MKSRRRRTLNASGTRDTAFAPDQFNGRRESLLVAAPVHGHVDGTSRLPFSSRQRAAPPYLLLEVFPLCFPLQPSRRCCPRNVRRGGAPINFADPEVLQHSGKLSLHNSGPSKQDPESSQLSLPRSLHHKRVWTLRCRCRATKL